MVIGASQITIHLPASQSLKDKRQVVKSLIARVQNQFHVAIAEVGENDRWQLATLGICCVSNSGQHASEILERVQRYIEESRPDILISASENEVIDW